MTTAHLRLALVTVAVAMVVLPGATAIGEVGGVAGEAPASGLDPESGNAPYDGRFTFVRLRYEDGAGGFAFRREPF